MVRMDMDRQESIEKTKRSFESAFYERKYYAHQTTDDAHLRMIMNALSERKCILDLGTGNGYLAFPLAECDPHRRVTGIDIVRDTLVRNEEIKNEKGLNNLDFVPYKGDVMPFAKDTFDAIVTRYALHHFQDIEKTFSEIGRILRPDGMLLISDPTPDDEDEGRFVDAYMQMKDDGHVKFYKEEEFERLAEKVGLRKEKTVMTEIRFPRKMTHEYLELVENTDQKLLDLYDIKMMDDEIYITEKVMNIIFLKE